MNEHPAPRPAQLSAMLFLCLAVDMAVRPFTGCGAAPAQQAIAAAVLDTAVVCLLLAPVLHARRKGIFGAPQGMTAASRLFLGLAALLFAFAGAGAAARTEQFFRYVSDGPTPRVVFYAVFLAAVFYALHSGLDSLVRVIGLAVTIFLASMLLMLLSNLGTMRLFRLGTQPFEPLAVLTVAAQGFTLPPELLLIFLLGMREEDNTSSVPVSRTLTALAVFYIALTFCTQAVLGPAAQQQEQTVHTLSRLGSISVFRRLDAMHIAAWVLAELCKTASLCYGVQYALTPLLPPAQRAYANRYAIGLLTAALCLSVGLPQEAIRVALTVGTAALLILFIVYAYGKEARYARKNP